MAHRQLKLTGTPPARRSSFAEMFDDAVQSSIEGDWHFRAPWHALTQVQVGGSGVLSQFAGGTAAKGQKSKSLKAGVQIGLPDLDEVDFVLIPSHEVVWPDPLVCTGLGLHVAVHRRHSTERLCLVRRKSDLARHLTPADLVRLIQKIVQLDHVNILRCMEAAEDRENLYLFFERVPSITLATALRNSQHLHWTQEQQANLARECCVAVYGAVEISGLHHLGLTLQHVLIPVTDSGEPRFAKVFGFGLAPDIIDGYSDFSCWPPEGDKYHERPQEIRYCFLTRLLGLPAAAEAFDAYGLGCIAYAIIDGRLPFTISREVTSRGNVHITPSFFMLDQTATKFVQSLLDPKEKSRASLLGALKTEWFRGQWRTRNEDVRNGYERLIKFSNSKLANRLFGRFLVGFLDAKGLLQIAEHFYALDIDGDGFISRMDLEAAGRRGKMVDSKSLAERIVGLLARSDLQLLTFSCFAQVHAEEVIDGRALRLAFESLDDDGSQEITPSELFAALHGLDSNLTLDQVAEHIKTVEAQVGSGKDGAGSMDNALDYDEFARLFPERVAHQKLLEDRANGCEKTLAGHSSRFGRVLEDTEHWMAKLESVCKTLDGLEGSIIENFRERESRNKAVDKCSERLKSAFEQLNHVPGPQDFKAFKAEMKKASLRSGFAKRNTTQCDYGNFLQSHALESQWAALIMPEVKLLNHVNLKKENTDLLESDYLKAHTSANEASAKLAKMVKWARGQVGEYGSFVEMFHDREDPLPIISHSGRGLRARSADRAASKTAW